jgi:hypothetical protein
MLSVKSILSHSPSVVTRKTGNEYILVPIANNIADMTSVFTLNDTGTYIWEQIDGKKCVGDIIDSLVSDYEIDEKSAGEDVFSFIEKMGEFLIVC